MKQSWAGRHGRCVEARCQWYVEAVLTQPGHGPGMAMIIIMMSTLGVQTPS